MAIGLGAFGLSNFAFLGIVGRDLGPAGSAPLSVAWTVLNAVGIGLFMPLEQEIGRRLSAAFALRSDHLTLGRTVAYGLRVGAVLVVAGAALHAPLAQLLFGGNRGLVLVLALGLAAQGVEYFARGVLAGSGQFGRYGLQLATDGLVRTVGAALLWLTGNGDVLTYGAVLVLAPLVATAATLGTRAWHLTSAAARGGRVPAAVAPAATADADLDRDDDPSGAATVAAVARAADVPMGPLVAASTSGQLLANVGPVAIAVLASPAQQDLSGNFVAAVTIGRIPLFFFAAVQAVFLPSLAALVALGSRAEFHRSVRRALAATAALALAGVLGVHLLGEWALHLVYGPAFGIDRLDLDLIAVSGGIFMVAQVLAQGLLAHGADRTAAIGWTAGLLAVPLVLLLPLDASTRVALALCVGSAVAVVVHGLALRHLSARWAPVQIRQEGVTG